MATSADKRQPDCVLSVAVLLGLFGCSGLVVADDFNTSKAQLECFDGAKKVFKTIDVNLGKKGVWYRET